MTVVAERRASAGVARRRARVGRDEPQRLAVAVVRRCDRLERDDGPPAVRRQAWLGRDAQAVQVLGARGSGHADESSRRARGRRARLDAVRRWPPGLPSARRWPTSSRCRSMRPPIACPDLPDLRPMLARPLPERSIRSSTCSSRGGAGRTGAGLDRAGGSTAGDGDVRVVDADGRRSDRGTPRAGRHGRARRGALGDPRRGARRGRCRWASRRRGARSDASRASRGRPVAFLAFDLLHLDGRSLLDQPLVKRREALRRVLRPGDEVVAVPAIATEGRALFEAIVAQGLAGMMARQRQGLPAGGPQPAVAVHPGGRRAACPPPSWPPRPRSRPRHRRRRRCWRCSAGCRWTTA